MALLVAPAGRAEVQSRDNDSFDILSSRHGVNPRAPFVNVFCLSDKEGEMSLQISAKAPARTLASGSDEPRAASRHAWGRDETGNEPTNFGLACRDVIDEVRQRMAVRGYRWD